MASIGRLPKPRILQCRHVHVSGQSTQAMTLTEASKVLGVDPGTLRVQIHNGKLKARKVGPIWTVTPKEVERYRRKSLRTTARQGV